MQMGDGYRVEPTPAAGPAQPGEGKPRARKRPRGAPTHVRSWPLRPDPARCRVIRTRFFTGTRVYNAVLAEFIGCSRAVKSDPAWQAARQLPRRTKSNGPPDGRRSMPWWQPMVFPSAVQSFASSLRQSWVRAPAGPGDPEPWGRGRLMRSSAGMWAATASRGSSRPSVGCIRWRPKTVMVRCGPRPTRPAGWWGCSGGPGSWLR